MSLLERDLLAESADRQGHARNVAEGRGAKAAGYWDPGVVWLSATWLPMPREPDPVVFGRRVKLPQDTGLGVDNGCWECGVEWRGGWACWNCGQRPGAS